MTQNELDIILKAHKRWLSDKKGGWQADLQNDDLQDADFRGADLRYANLYGANLWNADFRGANLRGANFRGADLWGADLQGANFRGADLRGANIDYSCWPLWCGSLDVKVDKRIFCQLAYHLCRVIVDDDDCKEAQLMLGKLANEFHRVDECGRVPETQTEEQYESSL